MKLKTQAFYYRSLFNSITSPSGQNWASKFKFVIFEFRKSEKIHNFYDSRANLCAIIEA